MAPLLAGAGIMVATAAAVSLLMALPAAALSETAGPRNAASRARTWLAALVLPPVLGIVAAAWALALHAQGTVASPHLGGQRPHLCLLPVVEAPSGEFVLRALTWLCAALVAAALLRLVAGAVSGHLLRRMMLASGAPRQPAHDRTDEPTAMLEVDLPQPVSFTAGLLRPVIVLSTTLREHLDPDHVEAIIAHERAHARSPDNLVRLIADACATLLAFLPTAWHFRRRLHAALEQAADDAAVEAGVPAETLGRALERVGEAVERRPRSPSLASLLIPMPAITAKRRARLLVADELSEEPPESGRPLALIAAAIGLLLMAALLLAARQPVEDSLFCAAEQFTRVAR